MRTGKQTKWMLVCVVARAALLAASAHADPPQLIFPEVSPPARQAGGKPERVAVSGKVTFPDGKPAEGIYVYGVGCNRKGDRTRTSARTDAAGTYRLSVRSE